VVINRSNARCCNALSLFRSCSFHMNNFSVPIRCPLIHSLRTALLAFKARQLVTIQFSGDNSWRWSGESLDSKRLPYYYWKPWSRLSTCWNDLLSLAGAREGGISRYLRDRAGDREIIPFRIPRWLCVAVMCAHSQRLESGDEIHEIVLVFFSQ
jgi:hypothetical protein